MHNRFSFLLIPVLLALVLVAFGSPSAMGLTVSLGDKGFVIDAGDGGKFTLGYPQLGTGDKFEGPTEATVKDRALTVKYANGAQMTGELQADGTMAFHFTALPADAKKLKLDFPLPIALKGGGTFSVDGAKAIAFPADAPTDAFLFRGDGKKLVIKPAKGDSFQLTIDYGWQQMQDNRVWKTDMFEWMSFCDLGRTTDTEAVYSIRIAAPAAPAAAAPPAVADMSLNNDGVAVAIKGMGAFTIGYPSLEPGNLKVVEKKVSGKQADISYAGDIKVHVEVADGGKVNWKFSKSSTLKSMHFEVGFGAQFADGGTWTIGKGKPMSFPADKPAKPQLFQGNAEGFTLMDAAGHAFSVSGYPDYSYQELTDLREWGNKAYAWKLSIPYNADWAVHTLLVSSRPHGAAAGAVPSGVKVQVDRFGQTTRKDFPGKVKDEADLKADVAGEAAYWASYKPLSVDSWGGLPGSKEKLGLKSTGFFHVEKKNDRWVLVNPDGNVTFHLGICGFGYNPGDETTYIKDRRDIYEWIPPLTGEFANAFHPESWWHPQAFSFYAANVIRKYGAESTKDQQIGRLIDRVRAAGFNAVGAFSGVTPSMVEKHIPRMEFVGFGPDLPGIRGVGDPFDEDARRKTDESWSKYLPKAAADPLIVGYFFANEQAFEDIPRGVPQLSGKYAAKRKLVEMLQKRYPTIAEFNAAWGLQMADFAALNDKGLPVSTKAAFADMQAYNELFLDTYYRFLTETFRKYDKNHLMVSNRWQPGTANNEALCRIAGKYMDVISINYYTWGVDRTFIERLYKWTGGKPQMWSEFFYSAGAESNAASYSLDMATQKLRGDAYRNYVEQAASTGYVVGIEWFSLIDQAVTGRWFQMLDGERANDGLFNACDRPYDACLREMAKSHAEIYDVLLNGKKPFTLDDPRFAAGAGKVLKQVQAGRVTPGSLKINGLADGWPGRPPEHIGGEHLAVGKDAKGLEGSFKIAWDAENLYILINATDPTPLNNDNKGASLWAGDCVELFIGSEKIDQPGTLLFTDRHVLLGGQAVVTADSTHVINAAVQPKIPMVTVPSVDGSGYTLEAAIPWSALDFKPAENSELLFDIAIDDAAAGGGRMRQIMWNGGEKNSSDRSYWGRLKLVP